jgi:hypothetical protein
VSPKEEGPEYTQLGYAPTIEVLRAMLEERYMIDLFLKDFYANVLRITYLPPSTIMTTDITHEF